MVNTASLDLASFGGTLEEMELSAIMCINLDVALEETIDRGLPGFLQTFCNTNGSVPERKGGSASRTYLALVQVFPLQAESSSKSISRVSITD